jgi:hypothetical protein
MEQKSYKQEIIEGFRGDNPFDLEVVVRKIDGYIHPDFLSETKERKKISGIDGGKCSREITAKTYASLPFTLEMFSSDSPTDNYGFFTTNEGWRYELVEGVIPYLEAGLELKAISLEDFKRDFRRINKRFIEFEHKVTQIAGVKGIKRKGEAKTEDNLGMSRIINPQTGKPFGYSEEIAVLRGFEEETGQRQELITDAVEIATKYRNLLLGDVPNFYSFANPSWDYKARPEAFQKAVKEAEIF